MRSELDDAALLEHADAVGVPHRREAVRDENGCAVTRRGKQPVEDLGFAAHVELRGGFVEQHDAGAEPHAAQRAGQRHALPLAARQIGAAFVPAGEHGVERRQVGRACRRERFAYDFVRRSCRGHVVAERQLEADEVLKDGGDARAPRREVQLAQIDAIDLDRAGPRVVQTAEQLGQRRFARAVLPDDGERRACGNDEIELVEHERSTRVAKADVAKADLARWRAGRRAIAGRQRARRSHRRLDTQHGIHRRRGAVEGPTESSKRDHRHAHGALDEGDDLTQTEPAAYNGVRERPEDQDVGGHDQQHAPQQRLLAQARRRVLEIVQSRAAGDEAIDRPAGQAEQPQLLAGGRIDRDAVGVVGVALRRAHFIGVAIPPDAALAQQPVRRQPCGDEHERRPPRVGKQHEA